MPSLEICILAGGESARMGRDKAGLLLGGETLLRRVKTIAEKTGWPVRVIRRDVTPGYGPLGGVYTALESTQADRVLFLACDMPFVTTELLRQLMEIAPPKSGAIFAQAGRKAGFPFILRRRLLAEVEQLLNEGQLSVQVLAARCRAKMVNVERASTLLANLNTPRDLELARTRIDRANAL